MAERPLLTLEASSPARWGGITGLFLGSALLVAVATAALTSTLVADAVEDRVSREIAQTARLLGGSGFPLGDESLRRMAGYLDADLVVVDPAGRVVAASLSPGRREAFGPALRAGALPAVTHEVQVAKGRLGAQQLTVGVAAVPGEGGPRRGGLYVLYPADLIAAQQRRVWLPVALVALLATLLAAVVGRLSERSLQRARTSALLTLLVSVAHELRNPLGAIRSLADALEGGEGEEETLALISAEAQRLGLLVEGLRSVGQPVKTQRRPVDPNAEVRAVLTLLGHQLAHRQVVVERALSGEASVLADPTQLRQVVLNLTQNAADAMPRGGTICVRSKVVGAAWELAVEDSGAGVSESVRMRLFEPFATTKPKGLGVGLYLSKRLVEAHGGQLDHDPNHPRGARFVLRLPLSERQPAPTTGSTLTRTES